MLSEEKQRKWDLRFLGLAQYVSLWSKDPSTKVGAVIVNGDQEPVSLAYNGFPRDIEDDERLLNNRELKLPLMVHAEMNALVFAKRSVKGFVVYTYPFMPCISCAIILMQAGIARVVAPHNDNPRWAKNFEESARRLSEKGVEVTLYDPIYIPTCHVQNPPAI